MASWMDRLKNKWLDGSMSVRMAGCMEGSIDGWLDGLMANCMYRLIE